METSKRFKPATRSQRSQKRRLKTSKKQQSPLESNLELVEDFGTRIRQAREAQGLGHEELGKKLNEKVSVLKKLESHKMRPDNRLAEKLQYTLKIRLLVPAREKKFPKELLTTAPPSKTVTLGDLLKSKKESEATK
jgi:putative transcription factor